MNLKIGKHLRWEWRTEKVEQVVILEESRYWLILDILSLYENVKGGSSSSFLSQTIQSSSH